MHPNARAAGAKASFPGGSRHFYLLAPKTRLSAPTPVPRTYFS
jgi:hypothetical protein